MEWEILKKKIYYFDGAWLDIYVLNASQEDWEKWAEYVNDKYEISFYNYQTDSYESKIAIPVITDYWNFRNDSSDMAADAIIKLGTIDIKCHFFDDTQIENDFDPGDVQCIADHEKLIDYMLNISKLLGKTVIMAPENTPSYTHISVEKGEVKMNLL